MPVDPVSFAFGATAAIATALTLFVAFVMWSQRNER